METDDEPESVPKDLPPLEDSFVESSKPLWLLLRERAEKNRGVSPLSESAIKGIAHARRKTCLEPTLISRKLCVGHRDKTR